MLIHGQELTFDDKAHAYFWGGAPIPGVTTILKRLNKGPQLEGWIKNQVRNHWLDACTSGRTDWKEIHKESWSAGPKALKAAGDIGSNVHAYAECFLKKTTLPELLTDEAKRCVEGFHQWMDAHHVKLLASERMVFSKQYYYAGTCDLIAEIDGEMCVGDFKTSSGIYNDQRFQLAAYQQAIEEEKNIKIPARWVIRFDKKTGAFEAKRFANFDLDFQGFAAALTLHRTLSTIEQGE
jgi:hypothetical protein